MPPAFVTISAVSLALAGTVLGASVASANTGAQTQPSGQNVVAGKHWKKPFDKSPFRKRHNDLSEEQKQALREAIKNCDYNAWKAVVGNRPITQKINEGNFPRFCEALHLLHDGKVDEARAIFKELGIKPPRFAHDKDRFDKNPIKDGQPAQQ